MMRIVYLLLVSTLLFAEDFISEHEYGQMLYQNPRGVSCVPCHGETGAGKYIVSYREKDGKEVIIYGPDIRSKTLAQLEDSIKQGKGIMPRYFLTDKEIRTIYAYLKRVNVEESE